MSSFERPIAGDLLLLDLDAERAEAMRTSGFERTGRTARTLVKEDGLRVVMIVLAPGGELAEHQAPGPITIRPLHGSIVFSTADATHEVAVGGLLAVEAGLRHAVRSETGATFLLTVADPRTSA